VVVREPLAIDVKVGSPVTVTVRGDLDLHTVPSLRRTLQMLRDDDIIIDCADLHFLDSSGIAVLVDEQRERERLRRVMRLRNVAGPPRRSLEICGLIETLGA
jgi:anti-sigma B factor antagonist